MTLSAWATGRGAASRTLFLPQFLPTPTLHHTETEAWCVRWGLLGLTQLEAPGSGQM